LEAICSAISVFSFHLSPPEISDGLLSNFKSYSWIKRPLEGVSRYLIGKTIFCKAIFFLSDRYGLVYSHDGVGKEVGTAAVIIPAGIDPEGFIGEGRFPARPEFPIMPTLSTALDAR
jgi:hypothetical protein